MDNFSVGIRLINLRKVNGYTQWDVVENLIKLADLYKVSCDYILCRE